MSLYLNIILCISSNSSQYQRILSHEWYNKIDKGGNTIMDALLAFFIFLLVITFVLQFILFTTKDNTKKHRRTLIANLLLVFALSFLAFSSLPSNYVIQKAVVIIWPILSLASVAIEFKSDKPSNVSDMMMTVAIIGAIIQMLFI